MAQGVDWWEPGKYRHFVDTYCTEESEPRTQYAGDRLVYVRYILPDDLVTLFHSDWIVSARARAQGVDWWEPGKYRHFVDTYGTEESEPRTQYAGDRLVYVRYILPNALVTLFHSDWMVGALAMAPGVYWWEPGKYRHFVDTYCTEESEPRTQYAGDRLVYVRYILPDALVTLFHSDWMVGALAMAPGVYWWEPGKYRHFVDTYCTEESEPRTQYAGDRLVYVRYILPDALVTLFHSDWMVGALAMAPGVYWWEPGKYRHFVDTYCTEESEPRTQYAGDRLVYVRYILPDALVTLFHSDWMVAGLAMAPGVYWWEPGKYRHFVDTYCTEESEPRTQYAGDRLVYVRYILPDALVTLFHSDWMVGALAMAPGVYWWEPGKYRHFVDTYCTEESEPRTQYAGDRLVYVRYILPDALVTLFHSDWMVGALAMAPGVYWWEPGKYRHFVDTYCTEESEPRTQYAGDRLVYVRYILPDALVTLFHSDWMVAGLAMAPGVYWWEPGKYRHFVDTYCTEESEPRTQYAGDRLVYVRYILPDALVTLFHSDWMVGALAMAPGVYWWEPGKYRHFVDTYCTEESEPRTQYAGDRLVYVRYILPDALVTLFHSDWMVAGLAMAPGVYWWEPGKYRHFVDTYCTEESEPRTQYAGDRLVYVRYILPDALVTLFHSDWMVAGLAMAPGVYWWEPGKYRHFVDTYCTEESEPRTQYAGDRLVYVRYILPDALVTLFHSDWMVGALAMAPGVYWWEPGKYRHFVDTYCTEESESRTQYAGDRLVYVRYLLPDALATLFNSDWMVAARARAREVYWWEPGKYRHFVDTYGTEESEPRTQYAGDRLVYVRYILPDAIVTLFHSDWMVSARGIAPGVYWWEPGKYRHFVDTYGTEESEPRTQYAGDRLVYVRYILPNALVTLFHSDWMVGALARAQGVYWWEPGKYRHFVDTYGTEESEPRTQYAGDRLVYVRYILPNALVTLFHSDWMV